MTCWVKRREKILHFKDYIVWCLKGSPSITVDSPYPYPTCRIKMTKHPSCSKVIFNELKTQYGAHFLLDALARYIARHNNPDATPAQIEAKALNIHLPTDGLPVYHKAKFWLGHSEHHPLSSNKYDIAHATPSRKDTLGRLVSGHFDAVLVSDGKMQQMSVEGKEIILYCTKFCKINVLYRPSNCSISSHIQLA